MKHEEEMAAQRLTRFLNSLLFETASGQRFTQDSPVLANVWLSYGRAPLQPLDLILTLKSNKPSGLAAKELRKMIDKLRGDRLEKEDEPGAPNLGSLDQSHKKSLRLAYLPGQVATRLYFDELCRVVLPLTPWWKATYDTLSAIGRKYEESVPGFIKWRGFPMDPDNTLQPLIVDGLMLMRKGIGGTVSTSGDEKIKAIRALPVDFLWFVRIVGVLGHMASKGGGLNWTTEQQRKDPVMGVLFDDFTHRRFDADGNTIDRDTGEKVRSHEEARNARELITRAFLDMYRDWTRTPGEQPKDYYLWRATKNRPAELAVNHSALTVKADAARRLFDISCKDLTWAIVDTGIDSSHPAFRDHSANEKRSRVTKTLDFTRIRDLLDPDFGRDAHDPSESEGQEELFERLLRNNEWEGDKPEPLDNLKDHLKTLRKHVLAGREVDWEFLTPLIETDNPSVPVNDHGTHVAGILAADWIDEDVQSHIDNKKLNVKVAPRRMQGICPDIRLIDCRVFREEGDTDEFEILAAIQYLRWLNARAGFMLVHGSNLSFSLIHEVRRYACGQTPICVECDEASAVGMVMVAAAGNRGFEFAEVEETGRGRGYRAISITDPGNAQGVITVGSTHRKRPHEYGVSFFSSRGPTGDGRVKPDLVAPGEKIRGPTPDLGSEFKDGTSMAAPHVSGAAAMLMARHRELIGKPARIKQILVDTTTDLERDPYFQGRGQLDVLRAIQSV